MPAPPRPILALSAYYFLLFGAIGVFWPNYGPFLTGLGLGPGEAAFIIALNPLMGLLVPPAVGLLADARRAREHILRIMSAAAALAFAAWMLEPRARPVIYAIGLGYAVSRAPISALADATAFELAAHHRTTFGRLRLWGSLGFLLAALGGGLLLEHAGARPMVAVAAAGLAAASACTFFLPAPPLQRQHGALAAWRTLLRDREHRRFLLAVLLGFAGQGVLDGCYSLHLARLGYGAGFIGGAWALGVVSEVALMRWSGPIIAHFGAGRLLAGAFAVSALRWLLIAAIESRAALLALQPLHGISFGCTFVAAATLARQRAPAAAPSAAQGLFTAVCSAGGLAGMAGGGQLLAHAGGQAAFLAATVASSAAALTAFRLSRH